MIFSTIYKGVRLSTWCSPSVEVPISEIHSSISLSSMLDSPTSVFFLPHKEVESTSYWKLHSEFVFRGVVGLSQHCSCRINAYEAEPIAQNQLSSNVWFHQNISDFLLVHSSYSFAKSINAIGLKLSAISIDIIKSYHAKNLACSCFCSCFIEPGIRNLLSRI